MNTSRSTSWHLARFVDEAPDPRLAAPIAAAASFAALLTGVLVVRSLGLSPAGALVATVALVAATAWWVRPAAALVVVGLAFLDLDGFLVNHDADLTWHGQADVVRLAVLLSTAVVVMVVRTAQLRRSHLHRTLEGLTHG